MDMMHCWATLKSDAGGCDRLPSSLCRELAASYLGGHLGLASVLEDKAEDGPIKRVRGIIWPASPRLGDSVPRHAFFLLGQL